MSCIYRTYYCPECKKPISTEIRQTGYFCSTCGKYFNLQNKEVNQEEISLSSIPSYDGCIYKM